MSVYIPGIDMPKSCNECRFFVDAWCYALEVDDWRNAYNKPQEGKRLDGCPLIPVPDHGRLIDADAFKKRMMQGAIDAREDALTDEIWLRILDAAKSLCLDIDEQPTIIPASKEGQ